MNRTIKAIVLGVKSGPSSGKDYMVAEGEALVLGRGMNCQIYLDDSLLSRSHCRVREEEGFFFVEDLKSTNGTQLNGKPVVRSSLEIGDEIQLGETRICVETPAKQAEQAEVPTNPFYAALAKAIEQMNDAEKLEDLLEALTHSALDQTGAERACVMLDSETESFVQARLRLSEDGSEASGSGRLVLRIGHKFDVEASSNAIFRKVVELLRAQRRTLRVSDAMEDVRLQVKESAIYKTVRSVLAQPLSIGSRMVGLLYLDHSSEPGRFTIEAKQFVQALGAPACACLEKYFSQRVLRDYNTTLQETILEQKRALEAKTRLGTRAEAAAMHGAAELVQARRAQGALAWICREIEETAGALADEGAERVQSLAERLRQAVARIPAWTVPGRSVGDLSLSLQCLVEVFRERHTKQGLKINLEKPESLPWSLPEEPLMMVAGLLLENAAGHGYGGKAGEVWVRLSDYPQGIELTVADRGRGIASAHQARVFEPFFSAAGKTHGVGLALAQRAVARVGGSLTCKSAPGRGSTFVVRLRKKLSQAEKTGTSGRLPKTRV